MRVCFGCSYNKRNGLQQKGMFKVQCVPYRCVLRNQMQAAEVLLQTVLQWRRFAFDFAGVRVPLHACVCPCKC